MKNVIKTIGIGAGALAALSASQAAAAPKAAAPAAPKQPNIVFFLVDDMGWMDIATNGSSLYETPNINRLASEGVRFTQAYSTCHVSSPARATIMTGRYPASINMTDWLPGRENYTFQELLNVEVNQAIPKDEMTMPELLRTVGYKTAIIGKWHLGEGDARPENRGFDMHIPAGYEKGWPQTYYAPFKLNGFDGQPGQYLTDALTDEALKYIEANRNNPFYLYFAQYAVHDPIQGRPDLVAKYKAKIDALPLYDGLPFILEGNPDDENPLTRDQLTDLLDKPEYAAFREFYDTRTVKVKQRQDNANFAAMVESIDQSLGRVMDKLKELGIEDNTVIIFTSDNGGMSAANFGSPGRIIQSNQLDKAFSTSNLPLRGGKGWLYEGGLRVPLIAKWNGKWQKGVVCDVPVNHTDFFPTLAEIAGAKIPATKIIEGQSLTPLLTGKGTWKDQVLYWHFPHYSNHGLQSPGGAIRYGDWKLIEYFERGTVQLFNIKEDIGEQNDLAAKMPEKVAELKKMLHDWRTKVGAKMMEPNPEYHPKTE